MAGKETAMSNGTEAQVQAREEQKALGKAVTAASRRGRSDVARKKKKKKKRPPAPQKPKTQPPPPHPPPQQKNPPPPPPPNTPPKKKKKKGRVRPDLWHRRQGAGGESGMTRTTFSQASELDPA